MRRIFPILLAGFLLAALPSSCSAPSRGEEVSFTAMDTAMTGRFYGKDAKQAAEAYQQEIADLEQLWSKTISSSDVSRLNQSGSLKKEALDPRTVSLLRRSMEISELTGGSFDPVLGRLVSLWGIGTEQEQVPEADELVSASKESGAEHLSEKDGSFTLSGNAQLDLGGISKGAATDEIRQSLSGLSLDGYLLSLGGNIYVSGEKPDQSEWKIGISDPDGESAYLGYLSVSDCAVITSGDYERFFVRDGIRYHHILDRATGSPAQSGLRSVTVVSKDAALADALSTALFVVGAEKGLAFCGQQPDAEAVFVTDDGFVYLTDGLKECFTLTEEARYTIKDGEK
ncbi:FAD:protein FMN transferase [Massiliimalia massiliensis]|uniref:FAD:protein FMN transferase n=1 Tax=Massiliimalia massiliensis TaxID=1852384 RepID=UPI000984DC21|nr:FAD:protein FMN transferase [Massiliimalia massiliensis]